jgi:hypothetical protein
MSFAVGARSTTRVPFRPRTARSSVTVGLPSTVSTLVG